MAIVTVPAFPQLLDITESGDNLVPPDLRAAKPVIGNGQWTRFNQSALWLLARGSTLVALGPSGSVSTGAAGLFRAYVYPHAQTVARLWCVSLGMGTGVPENHHASGVFAVNGGDFVGLYSIGAEHYHQSSCFRFVEQIVSPSATPGEIQFSVSNATTSGGAVLINAIACYEIPRATLSVFGPDDEPVPVPGSVQSGSPITEGNALGLSVDGLMRVVMDENHLLAEARRSWLYGFYHRTGITVGTSYTDLCVRPPAVLARARYAGEETAVVNVAAFGSGPAGSNVRIQSTTDSVVLNLPTSEDWVTGTLEIDCEDPTRWDTDQGTRSGGHDRLDIEAQAGSATATINGVCVGGRA